MDDSIKCKTVRVSTKEEKPMDHVAGLKLLRGKFAAGIDEAKEKIELMNLYRPSDSDVMDENIALQTRLIENYSQSIAFIDRYLADRGQD